MGSRKCCTHASCINKCSFPTAAACKLRRAFRIQWQRALNSREGMVSQSGTGAGRRVLLQSLEVCSCQIPREEEGRVRAVCSAPRCELQGSVTSWCLGTPGSERSYWKVTQLAASAALLARYVGIQLSVRFFSREQRIA